MSVSPGRRTCTNDPLVAAAMARTLKENKGGLDEIKRQLAAHRVRRRQGTPQKMNKRERPESELPKIPPILIRLEARTATTHRVLLTGMDDSY